MYSNPERVSGWPRALTKTSGAATVLVGVDAHAYLQHAIDAALTTPGAVTFPDVLLPTA